MFAHKHCSRRSNKTVTDADGEQYQRLDDPLGPYKEDLDEEAQARGGIHSYEVRTAGRQGTLLTGRSGRGGGNWGLGEL
jgi:hypothetical protein